MRNLSWLLIVGSLCVAVREGEAAEIAEAKMLSPVRYQVVQRNEFRPITAPAHNAGGEVLGFADVPVVAEFPVLPATAIIECRAVPREGPAVYIAWSRVKGQFENNTFRGTFRVEAGGWYRLQIQAREGQIVLAAATVEPFGVGEVFVIAGQSYATNCNEERIKVIDPSRRVTVFDLKDSWRVADDPQPAPDGSDGGSIWPAFGDALLTELRVPIGLVNVAVGATATTEWMPTRTAIPPRNFDRLSAVAGQVGQFRCVLWQQGESDVIADTPTETYVARLTEIRTTAAKVWGFDPPWLLAKSTLHPTVYNEPKREAQIRTAIDQLCLQPGFRLGPDTDTLDGPHRGGPTTRRHFTELGQRAAAKLWSASVLQELNRFPVALPQPEPQPQSENDMRPYRTVIPGTKVTYDMVPIPSGQFLRGSPASDTQRRPEEGPQQPVAIAPFWMGRFEVTWDEFDLWKNVENLAERDQRNQRADARTHPTLEYVDSSMGMGREGGYPAINLSQYAAKSYCAWLSERSGVYYRLPTEAEWEYACRAGTTTPFFWGDDPHQADEYAWHDGNSADTYHKIGLKKPNPWGLHDIQGNVSEWCLDRYDVQFYQTREGEVNLRRTGKESADVLQNPLCLPNEYQYPHSVRGGSWQDKLTALRSAARVKSDPDWNANDPCWPKSVWWLTDAAHVGFRIVRPLAAPTAAEITTHRLGPVRPTQPIDPVVGRPKPK